MKNLPPGAAIFSLDNYPLCILLLIFFVLSLELFVENTLMQLVSTLSHTI